MYKKLMLIAMFLNIVGCSAIIKEDKFISQDKLTTPYKSTDLESWQSKFPTHKLSTLSLKTEDESAILQGLFLDNANSKDLIFFIPGNGMSVVDTVEESFNRLKDFGTDIVYFDRRGMGASNGKATINILGSDALEQINYVRKQLNPTRIIVHGYSLGSFVAGHIAKKEFINGLVLEGSATNVDEWIDAKVPWYTKPFLTLEIDEAFHTVDNAKVVSTYYNGPLLIIGAENDDQVPVELSNKLYEVSQSNNKTLIIVENADHSSMLDNEKEIEQYKLFLQSL